MNKTRMAKLVNKKENQKSNFNIFLVILISVVLFGLTGWFLSTVIPPVFSLNDDIHSLF